MTEGTGKRRFELGVQLWGTHEVGGRNYEVEWEVTDTFETDRMRTREWELLGGGQGI